MAIGKWFSQQVPAAQDSQLPPPLPTLSADEKQFGLENVRFHTTGHVIAHPSRIYSLATPGESPRCHISFAR